MKRWARAHKVLLERYVKVNSCEYYWYTFLQQWKMKDSWYANVSILLGCIETTKTLPGILCKYLYNSATVGYNYPLTIQFSVSLITQVFRLIYWGRRFSWYFLIQFFTRSKDDIHQNHFYLTSYSVERIVIRNT